MTTEQQQQQEAKAAPQRVDTLEGLLSCATDFRDVPLPGGRVVGIGSISAGDLIEYNELRQSEEGRRWSGPLIIARSLVGAPREDGSRPRIGILTPFKEMGDEEKARLAELRRMSMPASEALLKAIFDLNGLTVPSKEEAKNG